MNAFGQLPNHNPVKFYAMLMLSLIVACFFALAFSACNDPEETKVDPDKPSFGNSIRLMKTRNNSGNAAPLDSFIYIPAAYGSKMKVRLEARNPGRRNSYLSKLRRLGEVDPNARFWHDSIDLTISDTMSILFTDTFFVCRRVRI